MDNILIYSDKLASFEYGENHPFKPERAKHLMELLNRYALIYESNQKIIEPEPLDEELLYLFHDKDYIKLLKRCDSGEDFSIEMLSAGLGTDDNPIIQGMYDFSLSASGATYQASRLLVNNEARFVFNPLGGFHHAGRNHAEGFCYINDIAITIAALIKEGIKVAYVDIDVHHGNGVQDAFYNTNQVLTISFHESGKTLYPWSGFADGIGIRSGRGYNINVPFLKGTDDEVYLYAFKEVVPPLLKKFNADIVFIEIGADTHRDDPIAHLNLTSNGYIETIKIINELSPKILATGGGGYNVHKTAALWTLAWAALCGIEPEDSYAGMVGGMMFGPEAQSGSLNDNPYIHEGEEKDSSFEYTRKTVSFIQEMLFPLFGIK